GSGSGSTTGASTVTVTTGEVPAAYRASPSNRAVTSWLPTSSRTETVAAPSATVSVPSAKVPARNVTVPVASAGTVAVRSTLAPAGTDSAEAARLTIGVAFVTVTVVVA